MIFSKFFCVRQTRCSITIIRKLAVNKISQRPLRKNMPIDNQTRVIEMQKHRQKVKLLSSRYPPSTIFLQIIGNGRRSEPRAVFLVTDHTRYLFNCGEGTQRIASEHRTRLSKLEHIFVTSPTWKNLGGLPGLSLTIQDNGVPEISLHGPEGTIEMFEATKKFVILNNLKVTASDCKTYTDQTMTVSYVPITKESTDEESDEDLEGEIVDDINYYEYQVNTNGKRTSSTSQETRKSPKFENRHLTRINSMMAYICKIHPRVGTLDLAKCVEKGVTPGPILGKLKAGEDVVLKDGTVVLSSDVVSPPSLGPLFIVLECPNKDWIDQVVKNPAFEKYQGENLKEDETVSYMVHFTPDEVFNDSRYAEWVKKFGDQAEHILINESNKGFSSSAIHRIQRQLNLLHPKIFPLLSDLDENMTKTNENKTDSAVNTDIQKPLVHRAKTLNSVYLRPHTGLLAEVVEVDLQQYVQETFEIEGFLDALADLQTEINAKTKALGDIAEYPKITMLGTGSSIPSKVRNTSGILLHIDYDRSILLDCGEGTMGQILRLFGPKESDRILRSIKAIYISHLHADHHLGLIGVLQERNQTTNEPVFLLAPQPISAWLNLYHKRFEPISKLYNLIPNKELFYQYGTLPLETKNNLFGALNISNICTEHVQHCMFAYCVAITLNDGRKITYSGDTIPCEGILKIGKNSHLLIHEATMEDGMETEAKQKMHSTMTQAINVGIRMEAEFTLLTHFSQRYSKIPRLPQHYLDGEVDNIGIAYDNMQVSLSELTLLPLFYSSLRLMYSEFYAELEEKANKRQLRENKFNL